MQGKKVLKVLKNIALSLWIPALMFAIFQVACAAKGVSYLHAENLRSFMINVVTLVFIAWGLTFNIPAHRWDFSVGSIMVLSTIIGGQLALALGLNAYGLLLCCLLVGAVLGAISGLIYVVAGPVGLRDLAWRGAHLRGVQLHLVRRQGRDPDRQDRHALHDQVAAYLYPLGRGLGIDGTGDQLHQVRLQHTGSGPRTELWPCSVVCARRATPSSATPSAAPWSPWRPCWRSRGRAPGARPWA